MEPSKKIRSVWLTIRLTEDEQRKLEKFLKKSTAKSISEYARTVLLKEPVIIFYRNQSADEFLEEIILLKKELNAIGKNLNQAVHKLHTLDHLPEFRSWIAEYQTLKDLVQKKTLEITERSNQIYLLWSQK